MLGGDGKSPLAARLGPLAVLLQPRGERPPGGRLREVFGRGTRCAGDALMAQNGAK
jgi:hypothetical protein